MANLADVPPEDQAADNQVESPVDGPTPDWMRLATSSSSSSSSTLTEEKTPDWLKKIRAGQSMTKEPTPPEKKAVTSPPPAQASGSEAMSDLERLLAEEGIDLGTVAEERPPEAGGMSARDWLIATSSDEIIRKQVGAGPAEPEPLPPAPAPVAQTSGGGYMSDLERLLAEEGIDLGTVTEERPSEAGGMSARDWLIATSSDEIIRKQVGAGPAEPEPKPMPVPETARPSPPPAPADADKMVVEEDLPDWLRDYSTETEEFQAAEIPTEPLVPPKPLPVAEAEPDHFVLQNELPDWLQEIAEESTSPLVSEPLQPDLITPTAATPAPTTPEPTTSLFSEDKMVVEEDLPDWLREFAAEEPALTASEPPTSPAPPAATTTPATPSQSITPGFEDKMIVEDDLPDWLREVGEESRPDFETTSTPAPLVGSTELETDLPDWLREAKPVEAKTITFDAEPDLELPSMGMDTLTSEDEELLPDWLREVEESSLEHELLTPSPAEAIAESSFDLEQEDLPDWLREVQAREGQPEPFEPPSAPAPVIAGAEPAGLEPGLVIEDELPDWLREVQEEPASIPFALAESAVSATPFEAETDEEEGLPDWLRQEAEEIYEPSEPSPESFADVFIEEDLVVEDELPDWLQEVEAELSEMPVEEKVTIPVPLPIVEAVGHEEEETVVVEEELPDWLREVEPELEEEIPLPLPEPKIAAPIPKPVFEAPLPIIEPLAAKEIAVPVEEIKEISPPVPMVEPIIAAAPPSGIPDWLQKLREVEVEETPLLAVQPTVVTRSAYVAATAVRPSPPPPPAIPVPVRVIPTPEVDLPPDAQERLNQARTARDKGDIDESVRVYESLVSQGVFLDKVIEDIQQTLKTHPTQYQLYQLMGDAMTRDGRLQSALNAYREALTKL